MTYSGLGEIGQLSRSVSDIGAAEVWWRDVVGLPHLYTFGNLAFFDCAGVRLMLSAEPGESHSNIIYFTVADIAISHAALKARGVTFLTPPQLIHRHADGTEEWMAFFSDNEGRPLAIMSQKRPG